MRRFVIGTAGHVDHGKTTLVRALTGVDTDRLPEEKKRGITIELGFARWQGPGVEASVIDVPGHRRLVHAMVAGAQGIELLLLVVAADEGAMPQTREHVAICELLDIRRAVVAVTKCDRVDSDLASLAAEEAGALVGGMQPEVVKVSARTGEGLPALSSAITRALSELPAPAASSRARLSVDRAFAVRGAGTVVTGTLTEGRIAVGDALFVVGPGGTREATARGLQVHDAAVSVAEAPTRLAVNLGGVSLDGVARGDVVTTDARVAPTKTLDVLLRGDADARSLAQATLHVGTARAAARVELIAGGEARAKGERLARVRLAEPLVVVGGDRFVLRGSDVNGPSGALLGGGRVLDAAPSRTRVRAARRSVLAALLANDARRSAAALVEEAEPRALLRAKLGGRFVLGDAALAREADALSDKGDLARLGREGWITRRVLDELGTKAAALVADHEKEAPLARGMPLETLRERLATTSGREAAEEAIAMAQRGQRVVVEGDVARSAARGAVDASLEKIVEDVHAAIVAKGWHGASELGVREASLGTPKGTRAALAKLTRDGRAVLLGDLWFSAAVVEEARARAVRHLEARKTITVIEFKNLSGLARKQAVLFLEHFDRAGITKRDGDVRRLLR